MAVIGSDGNFIAGLNFKQPLKDSWAVMAVNKGVPGLVIRLRGHHRVLGLGVTERPGLFSGVVIATLNIYRYIDRRCRNVRRLAANGLRRGGRSCLDGCGG